jgi:predicted nuclease with TOPRIM domain
MLQLLAAFWPFILDVFFNKKTITSPIVTALFKMLIGGTILLIALIALYQGIGKIFFETHDRYLEVSEKFLNLEKEHQSLLVERDSLYKRNTDIESQLTVLRLSQTQLLETNCGCKDKIEALNTSLIMCTNNLPPPNATNINDLLKTVD